MCTSASTVGLPRESTIWRPTTFVMHAGASFSRVFACKMRQVIYLRDRPTQAAPHPSILQYALGQHVSSRCDITCTGASDSSVVIQRPPTMKEMGSSGFCLTVALMTSSIFLLKSAPSQAQENVRLREVQLVLASNISLLSNQKVGPRC